MAKAKRKPTKTEDRVAPAAQDDESAALQEQVLKQLRAEAALAMAASVETRRVIDNLAPWSDC